jgi:hypothetical protein
MSGSSPVANLSINNDKFSSSRFTLTGMNCVVTGTSVNFPFKFAPDEISYTSGYGETSPFLSSPLV